MEYIESGEDPVTGLLPNLAQLRAMTPAHRRELGDLTADWEGPMIEAWRNDLAALDDDEAGW